MEEIQEDISNLKKERNKFMEIFQLLELNN